MMLEEDFFFDEKSGVRVKQEAKVVEFNRSYQQTFWIPLGSSQVWIFTHVYHEFMTNVGRYTIHGSYGT